MSEPFINITLDNLDQEHLCCAIADQKHPCGVAAKRRWVRERIPEGHICRKLDEKGKVFIEYAPLETAWTPVCGNGFIYIYCFWVSGSLKGKGMGKHYLNTALTMPKLRGNQAFVS